MAKAERKRINVNRFKSPLQLCGCRSMREMSIEKKANEKRKKVKKSRIQTLGKLTDCSPTASINSQRAKKRVLCTDFFILLFFIHLCNWSTSLRGMISAFITAIPTKYVFLSRLPV